MYVQIKYDLLCHQKKSLDTLKVIPKRYFTNAYKFCEIAFGYIIMHKNTSNYYFTIIDESVARPVFFSVFNELKWNA